MITGEEINAPSTYLVFLNGLIVGVHERPIELVDNVRKLRRAGKIGKLEFYKISGIENREIYYYVFSRRVCVCVFERCPKGGVHIV